MALVGALSIKFDEQKITILDDLAGFGKRTKESLALLRKLKLERNILVVSDGKSKDLELGLNNIKNVKTAVVDRINAFQVLSADAVLISKGALDALEKKLFK